ncbi:helix-turn-helix domain-containing protein [Gracilimonas sediminicola]|uniref:helix-turn-helix domain-containing protein n=1 Tax=Gracilimonas sediminicola TaxID=2952158 RepID=UPI0038D38420
MHKKEDIQQALALIIKRHRERKGLSQFELAMESELHRTMVEFIERRKRMPTIHTFMKLSGALSVSAAELMKELEEELSE